MARAVTRTHFHNSQLIRILTGLSVMEPVAPTSEFAEKLGQWVGFADAIGLHGVHNAVAAGRPGAKSAVALVSVVKPDDEFAKAQAKLEASIRTSFASNADLLVDETTAFAPFRKFYMAHQRDMALNVRPLRGKVRAAMAQASPALRQLAELDAVLDGILMEREKKLLATVPTLLEKRFRHLRNTHEQSLVESQQADEPDAWMKPGGWLARFCHELQTVLLAELDLRLQPTAGLIEACNDQKLKYA